MDVLNIQRLYQVLNLKRHMVGVKLIASAGEYETLKVQEPKAGLYYCAMVKLASGGRAIKASAQHFKCDTAAMLLGIAAMGGDQAMIEAYMQCGTYADISLAAREHYAIKPLGQSHHGALVMPLEQFTEFDPDVVIIIANGYQSMRIVQGYTYYYGFKGSFKLSGMSAVCFELTALPFAEGDINISLLCSGTRFFARWQDDEIAVGLPFAKFAKTCAGIIETVNPCDSDGRKKEMAARAGAVELDLNIKLGSSYYLRPV